MQSFVSRIGGKSERRSCWGEKTWVVSCMSVFRVRKCHIIWPRMPGLMSVSLSRKSRSHAAARCKSLGAEKSVAGGVMQISRSNADLRIHDNECHNRTCRSYQSLSTSHAHRRVPPIGSLPHCVAKPSPPPARHTIEDRCRNGLQSVGQESLHVSEILHRERNPNAPRSIRAGPLAALAPRSPCVIYRQPCI